VNRPSASESGSCSVRPVVRAPDRHLLAPREAELRLELATPVKVWIFIAFERTRGGVKALHNAIKGLPITFVISSHRNIMSEYVCPICSHP
jgi:hypothetical protein